MVKCNWMPGIIRKAMFSDAPYKGRLAHWIVLWSSKSNKSSHSIIELDFDPTETFHAYKLTVNEDEDMVDEVSGH